jgi:diguanylate cyclase (GGDEF)-like protein
VLIDIDKFKSINDKYGHPAGDQVIRVIGKLLKTAARQQDVAARYGGEEMALLMPDTNRSAAATVAETVRRAIMARPVQHEKLNIPVTASFGVVTFEKGVPFTQPAQVLKAADLGLYNAKHSGRNCVKVFSLPKPKPKAA